MKPKRGPITGGLSERLHFFRASISTYPIRDGSRHGCNQNYTSPVSEPSHLPSSRLRSEQYTIDIDIQNLFLTSTQTLSRGRSKHAYILKLLCRVLQAVCMALQNTRCGNANIHPLLSISDLLTDFPHPLLIRHISTDILQLGSIS